MTLDLRVRVALLVIVAFVATAVGGGYAVYAHQRTTQRDTSDVSAGNDRPGSLRSVLAQPHIVFQDTSPASHGKVAAVSLAAPRGYRAVTDTSCERVYSAGGAGLCLSVDHGIVSTYEASLLDAQLRPRQKVVTEGEPSRVRVSRDGRYAATTTFTVGHTYAETGFSTRTVIYDVATGKVLHNLEDFRTILEGNPYRTVDVNMWGVTFKADGDGFFATLSTKGKNYLVEGSMRDRTLKTLRGNVECPSLSPDGTRIAYKFRDDSAGFYGWRVHVLDLTTGLDVALPGERSVDDQVEWLDDKRVMYGLVRRVGYLDADVWVVPADATGQPSVFIPQALSPAVVRMPAR